MEINDPAVVAELAVLYPFYETALVTNDIDALIEMFWASPDVVRFGATENLYGIEEIAAFRKGRSAANLERVVERLQITTFGADFGSITLEFRREKQGTITRGRQSQIWVRLTQGWRIVSAHVSTLPAAQVTHFA